MWTLEDQEKGWCSPEDVGQEKLDHERWTLAELEAKGLPSYLLGTVKPPSAWGVKPEAPSDAAPLDAATQASIMETLVAGSVTPQTQEKFNKWADSNPGAYFPLLAKHNLARNMKEAPKALPKLEELTDEQIATMSSNDLKRCLLNYMEVKTGKQLDALKD